MESNDVIAPQSQPAAAAVAQPAAAVTVSTNTDIAALIQAAVEKAVASQLADAQAQAAAASGAPVELTPEQRIVAAIDNAGAGLGVDERLHELYAVVKHLASKVGL